MSRRASIVFVQPEKVPMRTVTKVLRCVVGDVAVVEAVKDVSVQAPIDLLVADFDRINPADKSYLMNEIGKVRPTPPLLILSTGTSREDFAALFGQHRLTHLMAVHESSDVWDLVITAQKLLKSDIFGIEKYFPWGSSPLAMSATCSKEKGAILAEVERFASAMEVHARIVSHFRDAADELFTNAIFNAPTDAAGKTRFSHLDRTTEVRLDPREAIKIDLCCDGSKLGIAVRDPFGSLTRDRLLDYLSKCYRGGAEQVDQKAGGAGLGLYYIFNCLSQFVANISPGKQTEVIGLIDIRGSYKDFAKRSKSFNLFMSD